MIASLYFPYLKNPVPCQLCRMYLTFSPCLAWVIKDRNLPNFLLIRVTYLLLFPENFILTTREILPQASLDKYTSDFLLDIKHIWLINEFTIFWPMILAKQKNTQNPKKFLSTSKTTLKNFTKKHPLFWPSTIYYESTKISKSFNHNTTKIYQGNLKLKNFSNPSLKIQDSNLPQTSKFIFEPPNINQTFVYQS